MARALLLFLLTAFVALALAPAAARGAEPGTAGPAFAELEIPGGKAAVVRLREEAEVAGEEILLGEIADVAAREPWLRERLEELVVGTAALPGFERRLTAGTIELRMRQARLPVDEIALVAPAGGVRVVTLAQRVPKERIVEAVEAWYRSSLPAEAGLELHLSVQARDEVAPVGEVELRPGDSEPRWGKAVLLLDLVVNGKPHRKVSVTVEASVEQDVWVAAKDLQRLEGVGPGDVRRERRTLAGPVDMPDFTKELRATRYVREGTVLTWREVEVVPDLLRGEKVLIVAQLDGVVVQAVGESLADARIGETVGVRNLNSGQVVYGTLTEEKYVAVRVW